MIKSVRYRISGNITVIYDSWLEPYKKVMIRYDKDEHKG